MSRRDGPCCRLGASATPNSRSLKSPRISTRSSHATVSTSLSERAPSTPPKTAGSAHPRQTPSPGTQPHCARSPAKTPREPIRTPTGITTEEVTATKKPIATAGPRTCALSTRTPSPRSASASAATTAPQRTSTANSNRPSPTSGPTAKAPTANTSTYLGGRSNVAPKPSGDTANSTAYRPARQPDPSQPPKPPSRADLPSPETRRPRSQAPLTPIPTPQRPTPLPISHPHRLFSTLFPVSRPRSSGDRATAS